MTLKDREHKFIEREKLRLKGPLTFEAEMLLRYGFSQGAQELSRDAYVEGVADQRATVLSALGAAGASKEDRS